MKYIKMAINGVSKLVSVTDLDEINSAVKDGFKPVEDKKGNYVYVESEQLVKANAVNDYAEDDIISKIMQDTQVVEQTASVVIGEEK